MKIQLESLASIKRQIRNYSTSSDNEHKGSAEIKITTARELSNDELNNIIADLSKKLGKQVFVQKSVDPSLIGGIVIQYGDNIIDGSVVRQLKQYKEMMSNIDLKIGVTDPI